MITIVSGHDKELDKSDVQALSALWDKPLQNLDAFFNSDEDEPHDFYALFFASLTDRSIDIDWKWEPNDILRQLKDLLPDYKVELISEVQNNHNGNNGDGDYEIRPTFNGKEYVLDVSRDNPDVLLDYINTIIAPQSFIAVNFLEDRYAWMLVPAHFDLPKLCEITGMQQVQEVSEERQPAISPDAKINLVGKQSTKIFFKPTIYLYKNNQKYLVKYKHAGMGGYDSWAGRILPGQTIHEGIATELKKVLDYNRPFDVGNIAFSDYGTDRKGNKIERYFIEITLRDELRAKTALGMQIVLAKV